MKTLNRFSHPMKRWFAVATVGFTLLLMSACESFLDEQPVSDLSSDKFWNTPDDARLGVAGIYSRVQSVFSVDYIRWGDARSDNFTYSGTGTAQINMSVNALNSTEASANWSNLYKAIAQANLVIKYVPKIEGLNETTKNHYLAQAHAIRAYMYFFIIRLWGDAPIWLEPYEDINEDPNRPRDTKEQVIQEVILPDLNLALDLVDRLETNVWKVNLGGVLAMLTDVYMWMHDYERALEASARLMELNRYNLAPGSQWKELFLEPSTSKGNIWSLRWDYVQDGPDETSRLIGAGNLDPMYVMDLAVIERFHQDPKDIRAHLTFDSLLFDGAPDPNARTKRLGKFAVRNADGTFEYPQTTQSEYKLTMYRYADILLLRAEALNKTGDKTGAFALLNAVRSRAGLDPLDEADYADEREAETAILDERQLELFAEGKRWFDLVRTNRVLEVMDPVVRERQEILGMTPNGFTDERKILLPIHRNVLINNPKLEQNPTYSH
ncbi:RagB/SusD family nutrient uptake outer membrane protein [Parapedobacter tibetensis]|uniref:RagB/SusD family nutrient uptake outer membrane protein n=1 Tax=Parapedobacter tibetensis TaxID=2972951 RepID=UPI00214DE883|nr:RagB/SusD family nutrient uptake outer membrane protein [Parapedobacter tibetensis]